MALTHNAVSSDDGVKCIHNSLCDGTALKCFEKMLITQGVSVDRAERLCGNDLEDIDDVWNDLKKAKYSTNIKVTRGGKCFYYQNNKGNKLLCSPVDFKYTK